MSTGYQIYDQGGCYYFTFQITGWVDLFSRRCYRDLFIETLNHTIEHGGLRVHAYVVMTNHVHCILSAGNGNLSNLVRRIKTWTAREMWRRISEGPESRREWMQAVFKAAADRHSRNTSYQIWTHENHAVELRTDAFIRTRLNYIHNNPVRAGWVREPAQYPYSSAADYLSNSQIGPVPVAFLL